jgi:arylsulfatase A-like enzyme
MTSRRKRPLELGHLWPLDLPSAAIDVAPTVLEILDVPPDPPPLDGEMVWKILRTR